MFKCSDKIISTDDSSKWKEIDELCRTLVRSLVMVREPIAKEAILRRCETETRPRISPRACSPREEKRKKKKGSAPVPRAKREGNSFRSNPLIPREKENNGSERGSEVKKKKKKGKRKERTAASEGGWKLATAAWISRGSPKTAATGFRIAR